MRCAIYFIPPREHELCAAATSWLRRDVYTGADIATHVPGIDRQEHARLTAPARRYGFHATIKAPFRLTEGRSLDQLAARLGEFTFGIAPFELSLAIERHGAFFAFVPQGPVPALDELAARVVVEFDPFRAPLTDVDLERRNLAGLTDRELSYLSSWGYPYVFDAFRFHMTLTGPVDTVCQPPVEAALAAHFGTAPYRVPFGQLAIAVEPAEQAPFVLHSIHSFAPASAQAGA